MFLLKSLTKLEDLTVLNFEDDHFGSYSILYTYHLQQIGALTLLRLTLRVKN
jgi:hypothetical protein